jgi:hypothetical protein
LSSWDRHRRDAELVAGADDPNGDLAAVGDEQAREGEGGLVAARVGMAEDDSVSVRDRLGRGRDRGVRPAPIGDGLLV